MSKILEIAGAWLERLSGARARGRHAARDAGPSTLHSRYPADEHARAWAHVSGWAQLSGRRQHLSCVLLAHNQVAALGTLLPELSDLLTECGYPWEIILVDRGSSDATEAFARSWCELPGFQALVLNAGAGRAQALTIGLQAARGDAVLLLDAGSVEALPMAQRMVRAWEDGSELVWLEHDPVSGRRRLQRWTASPHEGRPPAVLPAFATEGHLTLIDRRLLQTVLA